LKALRHSVGISWSEHIRYYRFKGEDAYDAADRLFSREVYLRDGQLSQGLLLREDARVFADAYLGSDDEDFFFLLEGPSQAAFDEHAERWLSDFRDLEILDLTPSHAIIGLDGPYAWELLAGWVGPEAIGVPYLTFFRHKGALLCRVGKTGEYGYSIILPRERAPAAFEGLLEVGSGLDVQEVDLEALDQCALENWFFNIRAEGRRDVTPIELQLQWRTSYQKDAVGIEALSRTRRNGIQHRLTCLLADDPLEDGSKVLLGGEPIGEVVNAGFSPHGNAWVALALLNLEYAYPHVPGLRVGEVEARTVPPPVLNNRSLFVNPQIQSYASRLDDDFPPIWP
jgi:glycine cleavage system aminomethyltransferase T